MPCFPGKLLSFEVVYNIQFGIEQFYFLLGVTDSICLPSASRIRNTLFLFEISSFICWCISKRKQKREAVLMNFFNADGEFQMRSNQMLNYLN